MDFKKLKRLKYKKYLYLVNDVTNILLQKEREQLSEEARKLRIALLVIGTIAILSIGLNLYFLVIK
jgi:hypothetical protein